jgi:ribosomal-protein-alanine N-acetyltransferase
MLVRPAQPNDQSDVYDLVLYAQRRVLLAEWDELRFSLTHEPSPSTPPLAPRAGQYQLICGEQEGRVGCFWGSSAGAGRIAHLVALIVHDAWSSPTRIARFLDGVKQTLRDRGLDQIAYVGFDPWLTATLAENGFAHSGSVVTLQKADETVPDWGNVEVDVRQVCVDDLAEILAVDERAFEPLWRTDAKTLAGQLSDSPFFAVAELRKRIVGYAYASLAGRHGHLTRLVVDPQLQGQRIGIRLLAECIGAFQRQGVYGITLNTQKNNARALGLYQRFGFVVLGQEAEVWLCTLDRA